MVFKTRFRKSYSLEAPEKKQKYPKAIFFIIGNEFCERFTFYGLKGILMLYLTKQLLYSDDMGIVIVHSFNMLAYFSPVLGAIIADSWLGKFKTILYISILYSLGNVVLSVGAFPNDLNLMTIVSLIGLLIIAIGTGGIKPCVSAFGGDQFKKGQEEHLKKFFSVFYLAINLGSVVSTYVTPIFREDIHCLGQKSCYPLAFGVPAILMVVSIIIFVSGKSLYEIKPPEGNIMLKVSKCVCYAIGKKCKTSEKKKSHWLDYADDKYDKKLIEEIKVLFHVLVLYLPIPLFWALFDQTASRWILQATALDGTLNGFNIKADQMQIVNPLLIIAFIPLFDYAIYPLLAKCNLLKKPLQRVTVGGFLAAISFVLAGLLQMSIESGFPVPPIPGHSELTIVNSSPCLIKIAGTTHQLQAFQNMVLKDIPKEDPNSWKFQPENCNATEASNFSYDSSVSTQSVMITLQDKTIHFFNSEETKDKSQSGEPKIKLFYNIEAEENANVSFKLENAKNDDKFVIQANSSYGIAEYHVVSPGKYAIYLSINGADYQESPIAEDLHFKPGGSYILSLYRKLGESKKPEIVEVVKANWLSIFLQIPQYIIITAGEIMLSITGLEFSYSQAPTSMKSVLQATWLLTVAFGNLIVVLIKQIKMFEKVSYELYLFATLMGLDMIVFAILAYFYKDVSNRRDEPVEPSSPTGRCNEGYVEETNFNR